MWELLILPLLVLSAADLQKVMNLFGPHRRVYMRRVRRLWIIGGGGLLCVLIVVSLVV
jgi:hypothetical protein